MTLVLLGGLGLMELLLLLVIAIIILCILIALLVYIYENISFPTYSPTWDRSWENAIPDAPTIPAPPPPLDLPENGLEKIDSSVLEKVLALLGTIALTETLKRGPWNVYDLHVSDSSEQFNIYSKGIEPIQKYLSIGDIYKYGITQKPSVKKRYEEALKHPTNTKDIYIYNLIDDDKLSPLEWYLYRYCYAVAHALEVSLIASYQATHGGEFPPANTILN